SLPEETSDQSSSGGAYASGGLTGNGTTSSGGSSSTGGSLGSTGAGPATGGADPGAGGTGGGPVTVVELDVVRPRVLVTTDGEIDDQCSMVRFLLHSNDFDVEGIVKTSSQY